MKTDLTGLPFDHFQRYATAAALLERLGRGKLRILEVGANRQRLLSRFFPEAEVLYTDIEASGNDADFVLASAAALPFEDGAFDAVVCLDVLEHIPSHLRADSVREMARVASRLVVIGCPIDEEWVRDAEASANACWADLFGGAYPWLAEHQEFGLVDATAVENVLAARVERVVRISQGDPKLWASLMEAHFLKERAPSLAPLVASLDHLYNAAVFPGDFPCQGYREFFVGIHQQGDVDSVAAWVGKNDEVDNAVHAFLHYMPQVMRPVVEGVVRTEEAWASTVRMYQDQQNDLVATKDEWGKTAAALDQVRQATVRLGEDLDIARSGWAEAVSTLEQTREREALLAKDLGIARSGWEEAVSTLEQLRTREAVLARDLEIARSGWEEAIATLRQTEALVSGLTSDLGIARSGWEETLSALHASEADSGRAREELSLVRADLESAKCEWSATARILGEVRLAKDAQIAHLDDRLVQAEQRLENTIHAARKAARGRNWAISAFVVSIISIISIAFL